MTEHPRAAKLAAQLAENVASGTLHITLALKLFGDAFPDLDEEERELLQKPIHHATIGPERLPLAALAEQARLQKESGANRLEQPRNKPDARKRLLRAYNDQAIIEQEIVMLRSFLGREAADIKPKKIEL